MKCIIKRIVCMAVIAVAATVISHARVAQIFLYPCYLPWGPPDGAYAFVHYDANDRVDYVIVTYCDYHYEYFLGERALDSAHLGEGSGNFVGVNPPHAHGAAPIQSRINPDAWEVPIVDDYTGEKVCSIAVTGSKEPPVFECSQLN